MCTVTNWLVVHILGVSVFLIKKKKMGWSPMELLEELRAFFFFTIAWLWTFFFSLLSMYCCYAIWPNLFRISLAQRHGFKGRHKVQGYRHTRKTVTCSCSVLIVQLVPYDSPLKNCNTGVTPFWVWLGFSKSMSLLFGVFSSHTLCHNWFNFLDEFLLDLWFVCLFYSGLIVVKVEW